MVTMILFYEGRRIVFEGSMADVLDSLRVWCPSGLAVEIFGRQGFHLFHRNFRSHRRQS